MISLEVLLLVLNGFAAGKLTAFQLFWPFVRPGGGVLGYYLAYFGIAVVTFLLLQSRFKHRERTAFWAVTATIMIVILVAASRQLAYRQIETQPLTDNDGVVQSAAAANFLLHGKNPYAENYRSTEFGFFPSPVGPGHENLAADHYAYLPFQFLLFVPTVWLNNMWGTGFDTQLLYLALFLLYGGLLIAITPAWRWRTRILLLSVGNPWLWTLALAGFNDISYVFLLSLSAVFVWRRWPVAASVVFGLALASKQTAWLAVPMWAVLLWQMFPTSSVAARWRWLGISAATTTVLTLPFFLWNPSAMYDDVVRYVSGAIPMTYPLSGHTILQYLRVFGFVESPWTQVPAWPLQLIAWLGMSWLAIRSFRRQASASSFLWWIGGTILLVTLVSRFAPDNYFLAIAELLLAGYALALAEGKKDVA